MDNGLPPGWRWAALADLGEVNRGRSRHRPRYAPELYGGPYPFIQTGDVKESGGRITEFSQTYSEAGLAQSRLWPKGTMCITIAANIAETGILTFPACFPDSVVGFIADEQETDVRFVEYGMRLLRQRIQREATGSVQDNINLEILGRLRLAIPPLTEQRRIADSLDNLDALILLNRSMNRTLEAMARALFRSWFVEFDPVRAKMEGRPTGLPDEVAALFPERLVDSPLGAAPEGWKTVRLGQHFEVERGLSYKGSGLRETPGFPMYNLNSVLEGGGYKYAGVKFYEGEYKERHRAVPGDLIVANTEQGHDHLLIGYPALIPMTMAPGISSHHLYRVRPRIGSQVTRQFLYHLLLTPVMREQVVGHTNGTTVNMLAKDGLEMPEFVLPPHALMDVFSALAECFARHQENNVAQSESLASLRDTLLPKLLSGELRLLESDSVRARG